MLIGSTSIKPLSMQIGGTARGYQALFASLAIAVLGAHGPAGGRPGALPVRLIVAALA
jgi:hypothetical protein